MKHKISEVEDESIASELGVLPGDFLLAIDGKKIIDVLDYRFRLHTESLLIEIEKSDGEIWEIDIEKNEVEDIGLVFESPLMSDVMLCKNSCIFCFVDQEPPALRKTLYVKDDDWRLSFLHGNFITLTNLSNQEVDRIANQHVSPLNISVHAADLDLRKAMMRSDDGGNLFDQINKFSSAGIDMNFQIVLCKDVNDGEFLNDTISRLEGLQGANSLAVVPVGLTSHRNGLFPLKPFSSYDAAKVISQVEVFQNVFIKSRGSRFVFLSDEWYIVAKAPIPSYDEYEVFPQLSNGVGMVRLFEHEFLMELQQLPESDKPISICILTGTLAVSFMRGIAREFCQKYKNVKITVIDIQNRFYGKTVTVSGLLAGEDIINQFTAQTGNIVFIPGNAFMANSEEMIDGMTRKSLEEALKARVLIGSQNGGEFAKQLHKEIPC